MTQENSGYEFQSHPEPSVPVDGTFEKPPGDTRPKPGDPGWVPPVPVIEKADPITEDPELADIEKNKGMGVLAYVCFILPLVLAPNSKFARFHANQALLVFIVWCVAIVGNIALWLTQFLVTSLLGKIYVLHAFLSCFLYLLQPALLLGAMAMTIYGIVQAANGERKAVPLVGQLTLIK